MKETNEIVRKGLNEVGENLKKVQEKLLDEKFKDERDFYKEQQMILIEQQKNLLLALSSGDTLLDEKIKAEREIFQKTLMEQQKNLLLALSSGIAK